MSGQLTPDQIFINKLTEIIHTNLKNENFSVNVLASVSGISLYRLGRRIHKINGKTVTQFIRETRLQKALEYLQNTEFSVSEVSYMVGFGSPAYFNHCFHKFFGYSPGETRKNQKNTSETDFKESPEGGISTNSKSFIFGFKAIMLLFFAFCVLLLFIFRKNLMSGPTTGFVSGGGTISIVVMPFLNMTHDEDWEIWKDGIQKCIISSLSNSRELKVVEKQSIESSLLKMGVLNYPAITSGQELTIAKSLGANFFISGSIKRSVTGLRIDAQLITVKTSEVLHSFEVNGPYNEKIILDLTDTLRKNITDYLLVSKLISENPWMKLLKPLCTYSPEALKYQIYGSMAFKKADWGGARNWFFKALAADSNYVDPMSGIYYTYRNQGMTEKSLFWVLKLYAMRSGMPIIDQLYYKWIYAENFQATDSSISCLKQLQAIDDQSSYSYLMGAVYVRSEQYDKAIIAFNNHLAYSRKKGKFYLKDNWVYPALGEVYHTNGQYKKERKLYKEAERVNDDQTSEFFSWVIRDRAALAITEGDSLEAKKYIQKLVSYMKEKSSSEADIESVLAWVYWQGGNRDKAEEYFRKALLLEPENPARMNTLANRLIERNKNFDEFLALIDKALVLSKKEWNYFDYLDTKGWGLYKYGKHLEALDVLQKLWDTIPYKLYYYKAHLETVRKSVQSGKKV